MIGWGIVFRRGIGRNVKGLFLRVRETRRKVKRLREPLEKSAKIMMKSIDENFRVGGRPKWKPIGDWAMATRKNKKRPPLTDTGKLRKSIGYMIKGNRVVVGTKIPYARLLNFGGNLFIPPKVVVPKRTSALKFMVNGKIVYAKKAVIPGFRVTVPERPFMVLQEKDVNKITAIFNKYIMEKLKKL